MIVPTPHCSPCNPGFFAMRSSAWENLCSLPDAGREDPAIDIATPLDTRALHTNQALSSRRGLMVDAFSITSRAASSLRAAAYEEKSSFRSCRARAQSFTAARFEMMSPHPDARSRNGDSAMTPVSMITAIGVWAPMLTFSPSFWIDAREDTTPSWLAAVGTLTNGTPALKEAHFATSMERPPPTPMANSKSPLRIRSSPSRTSSQVASGIRYSEWRIFRPGSSFSTVLPATLIVFSSATIKAFFPSLMAWQTSPTATEAPVRGEAEFLRGIAHCDARQFADALDCYERAATFGYEDHVMWNNRGVDLDGLGRNEDAIQAYTRAMQRNSAYEIAAYNLGNAFAQLGQFDEALVAYDRALAINPSYPDALYDKALVLARLGRGKPALQAYEVLLRADAANVVAWTRKGQLLEELNKFEEAVEAYKAATTANPQDADAWTGLGDSLYALERYEEAVEAYDRAIAADPNSEEASNNKGFTFFMLGIHEEALSAYEKALAINPTYKQAWYNKGYTFHGINRLEEAVIAYEKAIELDRGDEVLWNNLGNALYNLGRYGESIPYFEQGLQVNSKYEIAWNNIGNALNKMGRHAESLTYHDKALEIKPDFDYALYAKGHALDNLGRHEEGLELIGQSLELNPNYDHAWMAKAESLYRLGRLEEARDALNNALILNGEYEEAWVFRGKILEEMGNALEAERCYAEALQCFRASLELEPENAELLYHQALLLEDLERPDEAIDAYAASAFRGHSADALIHLSALLLRVGRAADALVPADEARSRYPLDARGHVAAGRAAIALNRTADAEALFRKALDVDSSSEARLELAQVLHSISKDEESLEVLQGIETPDTGALLLRSDIQRSLGRADEALADDDAAIRAATEGRDLAYRHKGRLLLDLGRPKEAVAAFDAAIGLHPTDAEAWVDAACAWQALGQEGRARN